jgi:hypothetical protein
MAKNRLLKQTPAWLLIVIAVAVLGGSAYAFAHPDMLGFNPVAATMQSSGNANQQSVSLVATPVSGSAPLTISFSGRVDTRAYGEGGYSIDFGDGHGYDGHDLIHCGVADLCDISAKETYTAAGTYTATFAAESCVHLDCTRGPTLASVIIKVGGNSSVSGMSKYTDADFGFSFWYPSGWRVASIVSKPELFQAGTYVKTLVIIGGQSEEIDIIESHSDDMTYAVTPGACGYCGNVKYFFDPSLHTWMKVYPYGPNGAPSATAEDVAKAQIPVAADVSNNTMGGLHMFSTEQKENATIIPLSARDFLYVVGATYTVRCATACGDPSVKGDMSFLAKTIVATDPSVATPVSQAQQTAIIEAERAAY